MRTVSSFIKIFLRFATRFRSLLSPAALRRCRYLDLRKFETHMPSAADVAVFQMQVDPDTTTLTSSLPSPMPPRRISAGMRRYYLSCKHPGPWKLTWERVFRDCDSG